MKKMLALIISMALTIMMTLPTYAITKNELVMTESEITTFYEEAKAVPYNISSTEDMEAILERTGSYIYDVESENEQYEPFEILDDRSLSEGESSPGYFPNGEEEIPTPIGIIGSDDRVMVGNTAVGPWCNMVSLLIETSTGGRYVGSGFMIGPNAVATAGHCVYNSEFGGWAKKITVVPARNGSIQPYGAASSTKLECGGNWHDSYNNQDDWGVITINSNLGNSTGYLGLRWQSAAYSGNLMACGYPASDAEHLYYCYGAITSCSARTIVGNWDITGGQSGGPVIRHYGDTGYTAVALNRGGGDSYSDAIRIDQWLYEKFMTYRS